MGTEYILVTYGDGDGDGQWRNLTKIFRGAKLYLLYINYFFN